MTIMHNSDKGMSQDREEPAAGCQKAIEHGCAQIQFELGEMYHYGNGVPENFEKAATWYKKAAEQGHPQAQYGLGVMCYNGKRNA